MPVCKLIGGPVLLGTDTDEATLQPRAAAVTSLTAAHGKSSPTAYGTDPDDSARGCLGSLDR